jgi:hypothetical protein
MSDVETAAPVAQEPVISVPRREGESSRAYEARVHYVTAGPMRSLDQMAKDGRWSKSRSLLGRWSTEYEWVRSAKEYDDVVASLAARRASEAYLAELEDHRVRYQRAGRDLYRVANLLLNQCARAVRGETIRGADGREYLIPAMELTPNTISVVMRALTTAADLEAHALRISDLLPKLDTDAGE